jgi:hypothetical protein
VKKSIILAAAAAVGLSLGIIGAQAGPNGHGPGGVGGGGGNLGASTHTPAYQMMNPTGTTPPATPGASSYTPGSMMRNATTPPTHGASGYAPGTSAPGRNK